MLYLHTKSILWKKQHISKLRSACIFNLYSCFYLYLYLYFTQFLTRELEDVCVNCRVSWEQLVPTCGRAHCLECTMRIHTHAYRRAHTHTHTHFHTNSHKKLCIADGVKHAVQCIPYALCISISVWWGEQCALYISNAIWTVYFCRISVQFTPHIWALQCVAVCASFGGSSAVKQLTVCTLELELCARALRNVIHVVQFRF